VTAFEEWATHCIGDTPGAVAACVGGWLFVLGLDGVPKLQAASKTVSDRQYNRGIARWRLCSVGYLPPRQGALSGGQVSRFIASHGAGLEIFIEHSSLLTAAAMRRFLACEVIALTNTQAMAQAGVLRGSVSLVASGAVP